MKNVSFSLRSSCFEIKEVTNRKTLLIFIIIAAVVVAAVLFYYRNYISPERLELPSAEEIKQQLIEKVTAPVKEGASVPKEVVEKLTSPKKSAPVSSEIIDKLSAPAQ